MSDNKALIAEANKCAVAVYLAAESIVADDISRILAALVDALIKSERTIDEARVLLSTRVEASRLDEANLKLLDQTAAAEAAHERTYRQAYDRGYRDADSAWRQAGDGMGLT